MGLYKVTHFQGCLGTYAPVMSKVLSEELIEGSSMKDVWGTIAQDLGTKYPYVRTILYSDNHYTLDYGSYTTFIDIDQIA